MTYFLNSTPIKRIYEGEKLVYEAPAFTSLLPDKQPLTAFIPGLVTGDRIELFRAANIRTDAVISTATLKGVNSSGTRGTVVSGPRTGVSNSIWYNINFDSGYDGWCVSDNYTKISNNTPITVTPDTFRVGDQIRLIRASNVRSNQTISTASLKGVNPANAQGVIVAGPILNNNINWYNINFDAGQDGWCASDNYVLMTTTPEPPVTGGTSVWRPLHFRPPQLSGAARADHPKYYTGGQYWGEGIQIPHCFEREKDTIAYGGDMNGFRLSQDGGKTWYWPLSRGLRGCVFHAIGIDPSDTNTMLVAVGPQAFTSNYSTVGAQGLYRTTNGGQTFTLVQSLTNIVFQRRVNSISPITCVRSGTPSTRQWRFVEWDTDGTAKYWRSNNGGVSWTTGPAFPTALGSADFFGLVQHPADVDTLYAYTSAGLWRTINDGVTWSLLGSGSATSLWIDPEATSVGTSKILSIRGGTVYFSNNGGTSWSVVLANGGGVAPTTLSVGALDSANRRTIYVMNNREQTTRPILQHWLVTGAPSTIKSGQLSGGATPPNGQWFIPRINPPASGLDYNQHWVSFTGKGQSQFRASQTNVQTASAFGYGQMWITNNRGADWFVSGAGFGGMFSLGVAFDRSSPNRMLMALNDVQCAHTNNLPDTLLEAKLSDSIKNQFNSVVGGTFSGVAVGLIPQNATEVPVAKRGRAILAIGDYGSRQIILTRDRAANGDLAPSWVVRMPSANPTPTVYVSPANSNQVYAGLFRSNNAGDSWSLMGGGRTACGVSGQRGSVTWATSNYEKFDRSTDGGVSWTTWYTGNPPNRGGKDKPFFWVSPHNDNYAITTSNSGDLVLLQGEASASIKLELRLANAYASSGWNNVLPILAASGAWCTLEPRRFYFYARAFGKSMVWRGTFNATFTAITWEDITGNSPVTAANREMAVHPTTGDVYTCSGGGVFVLPAPGTVRADSHWSRMPRPFPSNGTY